MNQDRFNALLKAAELLCNDYQEDRKPCLHLRDDGSFCGEAATAHHDTDYFDHPYLSLASLLREVAGMRERDQLVAQFDSSVNKLAESLGSLSASDEEIEHMVAKIEENRRRKEEKP